MNWNTGYSSNIDVTDEQWQSSINGNHNKVNNDGTESLILELKQKTCKEQEATNYYQSKSKC